MQTLLSSSVSICLLTKRWLLYSFYFKQTPIIFWHTGSSFLTSDEKPIGQSQLILGTPSTNQNSKSCNRYQARKNGHSLLKVTIRLWATKQSEFFSSDSSLIWVCLACEIKECLLTEHYIPSISTKEHTENHSQTNSNDVLQLFGVRNMQTFKKFWSQNTWNSFNETLPYFSSAGFFFIDIALFSN